MRFYNTNENYNHTCYFLKLNLRLIPLNKNC